MNKKNGAYLGEQLVKINEDITGNIKQYVSDGYVSLGSISGISLDEDNIHSILSTGKMIKEWQLPDKLILLDGDGHTWTALDYRAASEDPPVIFIESDGNSFVRIAKNFDELLNKMRPFTEVYDSAGELKEDELIDSRRQLRPGEP